MPKAFIWVPKIMLHPDIGKIRLAKQSRNIYISWKWMKVQNLANKLAMVNGKEGMAG